MLALLTGTDSYAQFITVLVVFVCVLAVTAFVTRWIANYQKKQGECRNIEMIEAARLDSNKWIQIVRVGDTYKALAVCKDTVAFLGDVEKGQLKETEPGDGSLSFGELFDKVIKRNPNGNLNGNPNSNGNSSDSSTHSESRDKDT